MVKGSKLTDKQYFSIERDSASSLKLFSDDRRKYYKRYILGETLKERESEEESVAMKTGDLVDCLLLNEEEFDKKFYMATCAKVPTGKMMEFTQNLLRETKLATNEDGVVEREFLALAKDAYEASKFSRSFEVVVEHFTKNAESYYNEKRQSEGKQIITVQIGDNAKRIANELKTNDFTYELFQKSENKLTQLVLEDYSLFGLDMKCKMDLVDIDHENKTIQIYDLKVTWSVENFKKEYYLYRKAYIQAYIYQKLMEQHIQTNELKGYTVLPPAFIVSDSINYHAPLIYKLTDQNMFKAENGFVENGSFYPGVKQLIEDLQWAKEKNKWNISRTNYENKGILYL